MKKLFTLVLILTACIASAQSVIYVNAVTGSDSNDGLTTASSKQTLSGTTGALSIAQDGDIVSVEGATYAENAIINKSIALIKTGASSASFSSITFSEGAQLVAPKPAPGAITSPIVTVNTGSSVFDGANSVEDNGTVFVEAGTYNEELLLNHSFEITFIGSPTVRDIVLAGPGIRVVTTGKVFVSGSLQFNRPEGGFLVLSSSDVSVLAGASVFPGNANSYAMTTGAGMLTVPVNGNAIIPVGTSAVYAPVTISNASTGTMSASVRSAGNILSFNPNLPDYVNSHVRLEWTLNSENTISNANVRFDYTGMYEPSDWASVQNRLVGQNDGTAWSAGTNSVIGESFASASFTSFDGTFAVYSDYANGIAEASSFEGLNVYPNPFSDVVRMNLVSKSNDLLTIQVVDLAGRIVAQQQANVTVGENMLQLNTVSSLPAGSYLIRLNNGQESISHRTVKF
ncbi:MAG: Secretion system C-terminal sorting domain [Bacteroidota bacterium]|jgi:hypothetical protein